MKKNIKKEYNESGDKMQKIIKLIRNNISYILTIIILTILFNIRLPYYISASGGIIDISNRIELTNNKKIDINGSLNMLYVTEYEAILPLYVLSYIFDDWELEKVSEVQVSNENMKEIEIRNKIMLENSIQNAIFVAYKSANKKITLKEYNNYVIATTADNGIKIGDKIKKINGRPVKNITEIKEIIGNYEANDNIQLTVEREGKEKIINTKIYEENGNKLVGIAMITNYEYEIEPEIEIKFKKNESGPSGGLMLALSIYNTISGEDIVKGRNIAGTGTIDVDGNVGAIDGIKYKLMGAVKNDMDIVLVPKDNYEEAMKVKKEKNYDIEIISISKFNEAIEYLKG